MASAIRRTCRRELGGDARMTDPSSLTPSNWENFYVIVGSSSGALIGLQFVVVTLVAESRTVRIESPASSAFAPSTVVHFTGAINRP